MQTDADDEQAGPPHELRMAVCLNEGVKAVSQLKFKSNDERQMRADGKADEDGDCQRRPDVLDSKPGVLKVGD